LARLAGIQVQFVFAAYFRFACQPLLVGWFSFRCSRVEYIDEVWVVEVHFVGIYAHDWAFEFATKHKLVSSILLDD
jgi:hypothetical protein